MSLRLLALSAGAALLLSFQPASATNFFLHGVDFVGTVPGTGDAIFLDPTFETLGDLTPAGVGLAGITGSITIGTRTSLITGLETTWGSPDNIVYSSPAVFIDGIGVGFSTDALGNFIIAATTHSVELFSDSNGFPNTGIGVFPIPPSPPRGVPEPSVWAMMIAGFAAVGFAIRRRQPESA